MIYRNYFGAWGRDLSSADFACALAALGVLDRFSPTGDLENAKELLQVPEADLVRPVEWRLVRPFFRSTDLPQSLSARALADAWKQSTLKKQVRLEVDRSSRFNHVDSMAILPWIVSELSRPEVEARSVYLRVDRPSVTVGWSWPLRVGLLDDRESKELRSALEAASHDDWIRPLVRFIDVEASRTGCDVLLLPGNVRRSLALATALRKPPRADCAVVLGTTDGDAAHWHRMVEGLRASVLTSGVAVTRTGAGNIGDWFRALVRELSHNQPLDVALFAAAGTNGTRGSAPFIAMSRRLAEFSRISMQLRRKAKAMRQPGVRDVMVDIQPGSPAARTLDIGPGRHTLDRVAESMESSAAMGDSEIHPGGFIHEHETATGSVELDDRIEEAMTSAAPPPSVQEERFIQAQVLDLSDPAKPVRRERSLRAGANHQIVMRVGVQDAEWISSEAGTFFPVDELPQDQDEWELTAVLSVAQSDDDPQVTKFILPRFGNSREASFFLFVKEEWEKVEARIVVLHRNRVIQTAMLAAPVRSGDDTADGNDRITVEIEVVARTHFANLDGRERFRAALVMNKSDAGVERLLAISDDKVAKFTPGPPMADTIKHIDDLLTDIVDNPKLYMGKLTSKPVVDLLRKLARQGRQLYNHIVIDGGLNELKIEQDDPIQVISAVADARLPIELVYSHETPSEKSKLCPRAAASLRDGKKCGASCSKQENQADWICPMAFWGVQRVIERHAHRPKINKVTDGESFAVVSEPTSLRNELDVLKGALIAGSQKVSKTVEGGLEDICTLVGGITGSPLVPVPDWDTWKKSISKSGPSLLVLIVHTEESDSDDTIPKMEIGKDSWLASADLSKSYVVREDGAPPLVLLLGCETGVSDRQFANFVTNLRHCNAAIVVATGAKIHSIHAVPVAKEFITRIQAAAKKGNASFGDVMLAVRREMLATGMPMVLALNAFGDADWRLAKHT